MKLAIGERDLNAFLPSRVLRVVLTRGPRATKRYCSARSQSPPSRSRDVPIIAGLLRGSHAAGGASKYRRAGQHRRAARPLLQLTASGIPGKRPTGTADLTIRLLRSGEKLVGSAGPSGPRV